MKMDVLIVGGGPAGLSAALIFGRCHRQVLLCDDEQLRNRASQDIPGLLGRPVSIRVAAVAINKALLRHDGFCD